VIITDEPESAEIVVISHTIFKDHVFNPDVVSETVVEMIVGNAVDNTGTFSSGDDGKAGFAGPPGLEVFHRPVIVLDGEAIIAVIVIAVDQGPA